MNAHDQLAHFDGATNDLSMTGLWYSHKRVAQLVEAARAEGAAEMRAKVRERADEFWAGRHRPKGDGDWYSAMVIAANDLWAAMDGGK